MSSVEYYLFLNIRSSSEGAVMTTGSLTPSTQPDISDLELLRRIRRVLHRWPELGHEEHRTSAFLENVLGQLGLTITRPAPTSLAVTVGPAGRPVIAVRADLDAISQTEETGLPFASERPGIMHACGHDGHTAALVVLARRLMHRPPAVTALLIFQQAEEVHPCGARRVIAGLGTGLWPADKVYGFHLWPELPERTIGLKTGPLMPGISGVDVTFHAVRGRSHGTRVGLGATDALQAVFRFCLAANKVIPPGRRPTKERPVVLHFGIAQTGQAPNQPAVNGLVRATMRWLDHDSRDRCVKGLQRIADDIAAETAVDIMITIDHDVRPVVTNSRTANSMIAQACEQAALDVVAEYPQEPLGVSDDFGCYLDQAPGALFFVGCGTGDHPHELHDSKFDFREEALLPAVNVLELLVRQAPSRAGRR